MSKPKNAAHQRHPHSRHGIDRPKPATPPMSDRSVYLGTIIVGLFVVILGWLLSEGTYWRQVMLGWIVLVVLNINFAGWDLYRGRKLSDWKQSLAKLPLRSAGYGTKDGKPLETAHGQPAVRGAMLMFGVISVVLIAAASFILLWLV